MSHGTLTKESYKAYVLHIDPGAGANESCYTHKMNELCHECE